MPDDDTKDYINLTQAARVSGYTRDHLGLLCRRGRLKGKKVGRDWLVTYKNLDSYIAKIKESKDTGSNKPISSPKALKTSKGKKFVANRRNDIGWIRPIRQAQGKQAHHKKWGFEIKLEIKPRQLLAGVLILLIVLFTGVGLVKGPVRQFLSNGVNEIGDKLVEIGKDIGRGFEDFSLVVGAVYKPALHRVCSSAGQFSNEAIEQWNNVRKFVSGPLSVIGSDIKAVTQTAAETQTGRALYRVYSGTGQAISSGVHSASLVLSNGVQYSQASLADFAETVKFEVQQEILETKTYLVGSAKDISAGIVDVGLRIKETTIKVVSAGLSLTETTLVRVKTGVLNLVRDISLRSTPLVRSAFTKIRLGFQKTVSVLSGFPQKVKHFSILTSKHFNNLPRTFFKMVRGVRKFVSAPFRRKIVEGPAEGPELAEQVEDIELVEPTEQTVAEVLKKYQTLKERLEQLEFVLQEKEIIKKEITQYVTQEITKVVEVPKEKITEITKEKVTEVVKPADYSKLEQEIQTLKAQIAQEEQELATLSSRISQISDTSGYITSPRQYQEEGDLVFSTVGSGSIILSAAQGILLQGDKIILDANAPVNQGVSSIEMRDDVNINSSLTLGGTNFVADNFGNLTLAGDLTANDITASGDLNITGGLTISASTTLATVTVEDWIDFTPISQPSTQQGRQYYDTSQDKMFFYNGSSWEDMTVWEQASGYIYPSNVDTTLQIADTSGNMTLPGSLDVSGNITAPQLSSLAALTLQSASSSNIVLNSAGTIELQDATNITGNLDTSGTLTVGTSDAFQVDVNGNITAPQLTSAAALTLQSSGSSNIILNSAGTIELQDAVNIGGDLNIGGGYSSGGVTVTTGGDVQAAGDFFIKGYLYREELQELLVRDHTIYLNYNGSPQDAYIKVYNTPAQIKWDNATSTWVFANPITLSATSTLSVGDTILSDGTLDLGSGSNDDLTASDITDLTDSGATALHKHGGSKTDFLAPEYESADLHADGSNNTGTMVSDSEIVSNVVYNYYKWTSGEAAKQDYDIIINLRVPDTFSSWETNAITFFYKTGLTGTTNNAVSWEIYEDGNASALMSSGEMASSVADTWASDSATSSELSALTAGDVYRIVIKLAANSTASAAAYAGKLLINYVWYTN